MANSFKPGDRVRVVKWDPYFAEQCVDMEGTILHLWGGSRAAVEFDKSFARGHSCSGVGRAGHCQNIMVYCLEPAGPMTPFDKSLREYLSRELTPSPYYD